VRSNKNCYSTNEALTFEPILGEFAAFRGAGDVIAYNVMSNILKTEAAQTKLLPAQTSTNKRDYYGKFGACGGLSDLRMATKYVFNILKTEAAQTFFFYGTNQHKRSTNKLDNFA